MKHPLISISRVECPYATHRVEHAHDFFEFFFSLNGNGFQYVRGKSHLMTPGEIFIFPPGMPHLCGAVKPGRIAQSFVVWIEESLYAGAALPERQTREALTLLAQSACQHGPCFKLHSDTIETVKRAFEMGEKFFPAHNGGKVAGMRSLLELIIHQMLEDRLVKSRIRRTRISKTHHRVGPVLQYIEQNYMRPLGIDDARQVIHVSRSHFHALFKESIGMTFVDYLTRHRIQIATRLLESTDMSILEISQASGFQSLGHFYQSFQKIQSIPPRRYRARQKTPSKK
ncbi:AraC family transcriptional regulator [Kamptonema cortianum]|nr:AraC family transcriptional regulator [Kamptonema cortianum]